MSRAEADALVQNCSEEDRYHLWQALVESKPVAYPPSPTIEQRIREMKNGPLVPWEVLREKMIAQEALPDESDA